MNAKDTYQLAKNNDWEKIPFDDLREEDLCYIGENSETIFHLAADKGKLEIIPKKFLTHEHLSKETGLGNNVYAIAIFGKYLDQIPQELITPKLLTQESKYGGGGILSWLITTKSVHKLQKSYLSKEALLTPVAPLKDKSGKTYAHEIALSGIMDQIDTNLLDSEILLSTDHSGMRVIDYIAKAGQLGLVNPKHFTKEILSHKHQSKKTSLLHHAAQGSCLKNIPQNLLKKQMFLAGDHKGETPLALAIDFHCLDQVPNSLLIWDILTKKKPNKYGFLSNSLWEKFLNSYHHEKDQKAMKKVLKNLSDQTLKDFVDHPRFSSFECFKGEVVRRKIAQRVKEDDSLVNLL
jgi:hypothetical protein